MSVEGIGPRWLEIDLGQLSTNLKAIAALAAPASVIPVIKADAYGHGAVEVARHLESEGCKLAAVGTLEEAVRLRREFIRMDLLLLAPLPAGEIPELLMHQITPTLTDAAAAQKLDEHARTLGLVVAAHLYLDTGMGRAGAGLDEVALEWEKIRHLKNVRIAALYSHLSAADEDDGDSRAFTLDQWRQLKEARKNLKGAPALLHIANSAGVLFHPECHAGAVRPGLLCYGLSPRPASPPPDPIRPVLAMKCRPLAVRVLEAGASVGYGRAFRLARRGRIMTLPVGYADGVPRRLAPHLQVLAGGRLFPVAGRICMDMMMVDLGDSEVDPDSEVTLIGAGAQDLHAWARWGETIPYELLAGLGRRWDRCYLKPDGRILARKAGG